MFAARKKLVYDSSSSSPACENNKVNEEKDALNEFMHAFGESRPDPQVSHADLSSAFSASIFKQRKVPIPTFQAVCPQNESDKENYIDLLQCINITNHCSTVQGHTWLLNEQEVLLQTAFQAWLECVASSQWHLLLSLKHASSQKQKKSAIIFRAWLNIAKQEQHLGSDYSYSSQEAEKPASSSVRKNYAAALNLLLDHLYSIQRLRLLQKCFTAWHHIATDHIALILLAEASVRASKNQHCEKAILHAWFLVAEQQASAYIEVAEQHKHRLTASCFSAWQDYTCSSFLLAAHADMQWRQRCLRLAWGAWCHEFLPRQRSRHILASMHELILSNYRASAMRSLSHDLFLAWRDGARTLVALKDLYVWRLLHACLRSWHGLITEELDNGPDQILETRELQYQDGQLQILGFCLQSWLQVAENSNQLSAERNAVLCHLERRRMLALAFHAWLDAIGLSSTQKGSYALCLRQCRQWFLGRDWRVASHVMRAWRQQVELSIEALFRQHELKLEVQWELCTMMESSILASALYTRRLLQSALLALQHHATEKSSLALNARWYNLARRALTSWHMVMHSQRVGVRYEEGGKKVEVLVLQGQSEPEVEVYNSSFGHAPVDSDLSLDDRLATLLGSLNEGEGGQEADNEITSLQSEDLNAHDREGCLHIDPYKNLGLLSGIDAGARDGHPVSVFRPKPNSIGLGLDPNSDIRQSNGANGIAKDEYPDALGAPMTNNSTPLGPNLHRESMHIKRADERKKDAVPSPMQLAGGMSVSTPGVGQHAEIGSSSRTNARAKEALPSPMHHTQGMGGNAFSIVCDADTRSSSGMSALASDEHQSALPVLTPANSPPSSPLRPRSTESRHVNSSTRKTVRFSNPETSGSCCEATSAVHDTRRLESEWTDYRSLRSIQSGTTISKVATPASALRYHSAPSNSPPPEPRQQFSIQPTRQEEEITRSAVPQQDRQQYSGSRQENEYVASIRQEMGLGYSANKHSTGLKSILKVEVSVPGSEALTSSQLLDLVEADANWIEKIIEAKHLRASGGHEGTGTNTSADDWGPTPDRKMPINQPDLQEAKSSEDYDAKQDVGHPEYLRASEMSGRARVSSGGEEASTSASTSSPSTHLRSRSEHLVNNHASLHHVGLKDAKLDGDYDYRTTSCQQHLSASDAMGTGLDRRQTLSASTSSPSTQFQSHSEHVVNDCASMHEIGLKDANLVGDYHCRGTSCQQHLSASEKMGASLDRRQTSASASASSPSTQFQSHSEHIVSNDTSMRQPRPQGMKHGEIYDSHETADLQHPHARHPSETDASSVDRRQASASASTSFPTTQLQQQSESLLPLGQDVAGLSEAEKMLVNQLRQDLVDKGLLDPSSTNIYPQSHGFLDDEGVRWSHSSKDERYMAAATAACQDEPGILSAQPSLHTSIPSTAREFRSASEVARRTSISLTSSTAGGSESFADVASSRTESRDLSSALTATKPFGELAPRSRSLVDALEEIMSWEST